MSGVRSRLALLAMLLLASGCGTVLTPLPSPTATEALAPNAPQRPPTADPESFRTPILPTPTFTPSPSPTPVMHIVESGDTLFGIAFEYGVAVEDLQAANGIDDPNALSIGQSLVIPLRSTEEEAEVAAPLPIDNLLLPTPTPIPLEASGVGLYPTAVGGLWCMGEVVNATANPVTNLQVQVTLLDAGGTPLVTENTLAAADYLSPGKRAPFALLFESPPPGAAEARVSLRRAELISAITAGFVPLTLLELQAGVSGPQYRVAGRVLNDTPSPVSPVTVVVTLYDAEGQVIAYREAVLAAEQALASGESAAFTVLLTPKGGIEPADYAVLTWGTTG